jgi:hypothetical protein
MICLYYRHNPVDTEWSHTNGNTQDVVYDGDRKQQRRRHTNTITQQSKMFWSYKKMSKRNSLVPEIVGSWYVDSYD